MVIVGVVAGCEVVLRSEYRDDEVLVDEDEEGPSSVPPRITSPARPRSLRGIDAPTNPVPETTARHQSQLAPMRMMLEAGNSSDVMSCGSYWDTM